MSHQCILCKESILKHTEKYIGMALFKKKAHSDIWYIQLPSCAIPELFCNSNFHLMNVAQFLYNLIYSGMWNDQQGFLIRKYCQADGKK